MGYLMAKALQPAVTAGEIFFELDRFELGDGDRLELSGRWFGVRGRRFVRPTLALIVEGGRSRALADLEHKPWAPEDGRAWHAAFPWDPDAGVLEAELSVAPDITVRLPAPSPRLESAQRIELISRDDSRPMRPITRGRSDHTAEAETRSAPTRRRAAKPADGRDELKALREELAAMRSELDRVRSELEAAQTASAESANTAAAAGVELAAAQERRDAAVGRLDAAIEARDAATRARDQVAAERDRERLAREQLAAERDRVEQSARRIGAELEQAQDALEQAVHERQNAAQARDRALGERDALAQNGARLAQQRDEAVTARGAAMVMRNATRALPSHERHAGWVQRSLAIVLLVGAIFALLVVLHVL